VTAPPRRREVRLRCAKCRRQVGKARNGIRRYFILDIDDDRLDGPATTLTHTAIRCICNYRPRINAEDAGAAAERAWELGRDLMLGAPDYGLPPAQRDTVSAD
jgi:hypothetical protein